MAFIHRQVPGDLPESLRFETDAHVAGDFLKLARTIGSAKAALHRVRRHEELEGSPY
jgi:hypothetical protein